MIYTVSLNEPDFNYAEILRYAGGKGENAAVTSLMHKCTDDVRGKIALKACYGIFDTADIMPSCKLLKQYLSGTEKGILFAVTCGVQLDRLIGKFSRIEPSRALMLQAIGAERTEALADSLTEFLKKQYAYEFKPRISPGYGDWPLSDQKKIFSYLDCGKKLGMALNDSMLISPSKSVTALIGLKR